MYRFKDADSGFNIDEKSIFIKIILFPVTENLNSLNSMFAYRFLNMNNIYRHTKIKCKFSNLYFCIEQIHSANTNKYL